MVLRGLFQANVLALLLKERMISSELVERMRTWRHSGFHAFAGVVRNDLDRFHLVNDVIDRVPGLAARAACAKQVLRDRLIDHRQYITLHGEDMPEVRDWTWPY